MKTLIAVLFTLAVNTTAFAQEPCNSKLQTLVNKTGQKAIMATPCKVWMIPGLLNIPQADSIQGIILIAQEDDLVVVGTVVQAKALQSISRDKLVKLMQMNNNIDYAKVGIDNDGDLFVRSELRITNLTSADFNSTLQHVINGGNRVYDLMKK